jgi:hypothetical protein
MDVVRPARGDFGATITFAMRKRDDTVFDIGTATSLKGYLSKPDGTVVTRDGTVVGDGSAGQFTVTLADGDLDQDGDHMLEPDVIFSNAEYGGMPFRFRVRPSARS